MYLLFLVAVTNRIVAIPVNVTSPKDIYFRVGFLMNKTPTHFFTLGNGSNSCVFLEKKTSILELTLTHDGAHEIYTAPAPTGNFVFEWPAKTINSSDMSLVLTQGVLMMPYLDSFRFVAPITELTLSAGGFNVSPALNAYNNNNNNNKCGLSYLTVIPFVVLLAMSRYDLYMKLWKAYISDSPREPYISECQQTIV